MKMVNLGKSGLTTMIVMGVFLVLVVGFSVFVPSSNGLWPVSGARSLDSELQKDVNEGDEVVKDELLPTGFDEESCLSRRQSLLYRRRPHLPASPHLLSKLRSYEARHKMCGPQTESFNKSVEALKAGTYSASDSGCNYIVWLPMHGLGNRILTLTSTFLFALLTDRVLLVDRGIDSRHLFCEPFPEASWLLPSGFPLADEFRWQNQRSPRCYGEMLKKQKQSNSSASASLIQQPYVYLNLPVDFDEEDKQVFCDEDQEYLQKIPWLVTRSNTYYLPSFFLMPMYRQELDRLFPNKETVFHLLGRYLLHPTNSVWGLITRYYNAYLSKADVTVGIQIRIFDTSPTNLSKHVLDQIVSCTARENILPEIRHEGRGVGPDTKRKRKRKRVAVLMTSLASGYFEGVRDLYWENPTATGDVVAVFQPSNEVYEQNEKADHNRKAWAEIYLLSMADELVTSSWSTFGYAAQGLAGLRPWILEVPNNETTPDPPCRRGMSMEPCNHGAPKYTCKSKTRVDAVVPYVRGCEDRFWDMKLFQN